MGMKIEAHDIFITLARDARKQNTKAVFEKIAKGEDLDYELLEQVKSSLEDFSSQSIWEEGGLSKAGETC